MASRRMFIAGMAALPLLPTASDDQRWFRFRFTKLETYQIDFVEIARLQPVPDIWLNQK